MRNQSGFSLVQVMIAVSLLGGVALGFMQLMKNMNQMQNQAESRYDEVELKNSIRLLVDVEKHCRVSLAGEGITGTPTTPVIFKKSDIDQPGEGLEIELYMANQEGILRNKKRFSATDPSLRRFGKLTFKSIKLLMNNGSGFDYTEDLVHSDIGELQVVMEKKIGDNQKRDIVLSYDLNVFMRTNAAGQSMMLSCSGSGGGQIVKVDNCAFTEWVLEANDSMVSCGTNQVMNGAGLRINGENEYIRLKCCDIKIGY